MLSSPRRPVRTMRIFSSAENWRRVARRISFTTCLAGSFTDPDFCPICAPSMATMGQKSSLTQPALSVSQVLMPDMRKIADEVTETLDYVPGRFKVIRHIREKLSCRVCDTVVAAPTPDHAIARGRAGAGLLAHIVVSKYDDHLPLYRQAEIFARAGVSLETSTLCGW